MFICHLIFPKGHDKEIISASHFTCQWYILISKLGKSWFPKKHTAFFFVDAAECYGCSLK